MFKTILNIQLHFGYLEVVPHWLLRTTLSHIHHFQQGLLSQEAGYVSEHLVVAALVVESACSALLAQLLEGPNTHTLC